MANTLLQRMREKDKTGLFSSSQTSVLYPTGFAPFDYRNGYIVEVRDDDEGLIKRYASIGITGGTFITIIGKTGTAKTTFSIQMAYNIVRRFPDNSFVIHYDLEQVLSYTRVKNVTGASQIDLQDKYIIRQEKNYIEDIFDSIVMLCNEKELGKKDYRYNTGLLDEFGNEIWTYVPTVVIIDSLPTLSSKNEDEEMKGGTEAARRAKDLKQFYAKLMPLIKTYNITVVAINHINAKMEINPFSKTQSQVMYLKQDESVPGGVAPIYLANNLLKFVSTGKLNKEDDGLDGFTIRCEFLKSRTNAAGKFVTMVYNQITGFDPILTLYQFADENGLVGGRNPYKFFKINEDVKFNYKHFKEEFLKREEVRIALTAATKPVLEGLLSTADVDNAISEEQVKMLKEFFEE